VQIVGINGKAGAGKDTLAGVFIEHGYVGIALADEMKRFCAKVFGFSRDQLWGPSGLRDAIDSRWGISPRRALQTLGTEWGRRLHEDVWIARVVDIVTTLERESFLGYDRVHGIGVIEFDRPFRRPASGCGFVITDVRFVNEMRQIRDLGGALVRVRRAGAGLVGAAGEHTSEREQDTIPDIDFDIVIDNDGTLADLRRRVVMAFGLTGSLEDA
jgi:hypothetical protein